MRFYNVEALNIVTVWYMGLSNLINGIHNSIYRTLINSIFLDAQRRFTDGEAAR